MVGKSLDLTDLGQFVLRDFANAQWPVTVTNVEQLLDNPLRSDDDRDIVDTRVGPNEFKPIRVNDRR